MLPSNLQQNHSKAIDEELKKSMGITIGWVMLFTHVVFLLAIQYTQPATEFYDNTILRSLSIASCVLLACSGYWQEKLKWLVPWAQQGFSFLHGVMSVYLSMDNIHNQDTSSLAWMVGIIIVLAACSVFFTQILGFLLHVFLIHLISQGLFFWVEGHFFQYSLSQDPDSRFLLYLACIGLPCIGGFFSVAKLKMNYWNKLLRGLAASTAHEMRNPLAQLHAILQMMEQQLCQDGAKSNISFEPCYRVIVQALQQIDLILNSLDNKPIDPSKLQLLSAQDVVDEALAEYAYEEVEQAKSISVAGEDFKLEAEPVMFKYIIFNLLQNALWFTKTQPDGKIQITLKATGNKNIIQIRDNGPGIAADAISQVFDNFYTLGKQGGTGMGLVYCKRTMLAIGGDITCESEVGEYTLFTLSFPAPAVPPHQHQTTHPSGEPAKPSPSDPNTICLAGKTVLIVDDDNLNRTLIKGILHSWDIDCLEAVNGQEALRILGNSRCDLVLTDMQMPLMDGLELVQSIRRRERGSGDVPLPVIMLTAERDNMITTAMQLGANGHLIKPVDAAILLPLLQRWLSDLKL